MTVTIDRDHNEIHEGDHYFYDKYTTISSGGTASFVYLTGDKECHFVFGVGSDTAGFTINTYEGVTADADGTLLTVNNNFRKKTENASSVVLRLNPSNISISGATELRNSYNGTATNPAKATSGTVVRDREIILKRNTKYMLKITNNYAGDNPVNIFMTWYEI